MPITWSDFEKVDIRVGTVTEARAFPQARRPAYQLWIDFGPLGVKRSSAQLTDRYAAADLPGRQVVGIHCLDLVWGLGSVHCSTHQEPALPG